MKLGQILGQIQYQGTPGLDMSQNPKHELGQVLGMILGQQKCLLNCTPGRLYIASLLMGSASLFILAHVFSLSFSTIPDSKSV